MKKMKKIILPITFMFFSQTDDAEYEKVLEQSPFNKMYPQFMAKEAADYFKEFNKLFTEEGPIAPKEARLAAVAVSAAIRCEYCISAQVHLAKKEGATDDEIKYYDVDMLYPTDDEIKAAVQIAAEIQRFSVLLYGNEFGLDNLERIIGKQ